MMTSGVFLRTQKYLQRHDGFRPRLAHCEMKHSDGRRAVRQGYSGIESLAPGLRCCNCVTYWNWRHYEREANSCATDGQMRHGQFGSRRTPDTGLVRLHCPGDPDTFYWKAYVYVPSG